MGRSVMRNKLQSPRIKRSSSLSSACTVLSIKDSFDGPKKAKKKRNVRKGHCFNCDCDETETDLWRSDIFAPKGVKQMVCNACGLWSRDHGEYRPPHMFKHLKTRAEKSAQLEAAVRAVREEVATIKAQASQASSRTSTPHTVCTPLIGHTDFISPSPSPLLPEVPATTPTADCFGHKKARHLDDLAAASTLLSMMGGSSYHETPPPLPRSECSGRTIRAPSPTQHDTHPSMYAEQHYMSPPSANHLRHIHAGPQGHANRHSHRNVHGPGPSYMTHQHSYSYPEANDHLPAPSCHLFDTAASNRYVPSWMDGVRPSIVPTTPTQAHYGRRRNSEPSPDVNATPTSATMERINSTPTYVRPFIGNICHGRSQSPSASMPETAYPMMYDRRRSSSRSSQDSYASYSSSRSGHSSVLVSPATEHMPLAGHHRRDDSSYFPDLSHLHLNK